MGIIFGMIAAFGFGASDFLVTQVTRRVGVLKAMLVIQLFGVLIIGTILAVTQQFPPLQWSIWGLMVVISIINFVATMLLYRSFAIGTLSIVSPIASGFAVVTAVLSLMFNRENLPTLTLVGTPLLIVGVIVVSRVPGTSGAPSFAGIPEALGAAIGFGIYFWAINRITPTLGVFWPVLVVRLVQLIGVLIVLGIRGRSENKWTWRVAPLLLMAAVLDSSALLAFNLGVGQTYATITTALTSLYSAVAVLLAWLFMRERLSRGQWIGVGVVLVGVLLVSM